MSHLNANAPSRASPSPSPPPSHLKKCFSETGFLYILLVALELDLYTRLTSEIHLPQPLKHWN